MAEELVKIRIEKSNQWLSLLFNNMSPFIILVLLLIQTCFMNSCTKNKLGLFINLSNDNKFGLFIPYNDSCFYTNISPLPFDELFYDFKVSCGLDSFYVLIHKTVDLKYFCDDPIQNLKELSEHYDRAYRKVIIPRASKIEIFSKLTKNKESCKSILVEKYPDSTYRTIIHLEKSFISAVICIDSKDLHPKEYIQMYNELYLGKLR